MFDLINISGRKRLIFHFLLWSGLYVCWIFVFRNVTLTFSRTMQIEFCYLVFIAANYYFNVYISIPRLLSRQRYVLFVLSSAVFLLISAWLRAEVVLFINWNLYLVPASQIDFGKLYFNSLLNIFIWTLALVAIETIIERIRFQQYALLMEKEKVKNELEFLRAQNNPHFLFNALNSVYFQIDKGNKDARESLMRLSEILRYQLYDCNTEVVPIDREIIFLRNYIELQKLRLGTNYLVDVSIGESVHDFMLAPLLLMPLIENAFKYVSHFTGRENKISVTLQYENDSFQCTVINTTDTVQSPKTVESGGIGLKNLRRRLELLYPDRHELKTDDKNDRFSATLILRIDEDQLHHSR